MIIHGLLLCDDLMFGSRITGTAHDLGRKVRTVRDTATLMQLADEHHPGVVFLDLHTPHLDINAVVAQLKSQEPNPYIISFGSHVDAATLTAAREAGCDLVLPRSAFVQRLPREMSSWLEGQPISPS